MFLIAIAIGPVQDFIAASRKTRDLWCGSTLLSRSAGAAACSLQSQGATLIFPALDAQEAIDNDAPFPNKLLAYLPLGDPVEVTKHVEIAARGVLSSALAGVLNTLPFPDHLHREMATAQVAEFLEFYAAWVPFSGKDEDYPACRLRVEHLLAGRKLMREFAPAKGPELYPVGGVLQSDLGVAKSSLDPSRNTIFRARPPGSAQFLPSSASNPVRVDAVRRALRIKRGEQLDGISLVKRHADPKRFVSISRITVDPFIRRLASDRHEILKDLRDKAEELVKLGAVDRFPITANSGLNQFADFPYDTQFFFEPKTEIEELDTTAQNAATAFHEIVRKASQDLEISILPNEVAILAADGDGMGRAIAQRVTQQAHQQFSKQLDEFASTARRTVAKHQGAAIYTGGDDVLAMLPLDTALQCAAALHDDFARIANTMIPSGGDPVTLSVGIAVGQYSTHLQSLLQWARNAERAAKDGGRNALAVAVHTGDGQSTVPAIVHSWNADPVTSRWLKWVEWYRRGAISHRTGYELRELIAEYEIVDETLLTERRYRTADSGRSRSLLQLEVRHILESKRPGEKQVTMESQDIELVMLALGGDLSSLTTLASELIAARHFAAAVAINQPQQSTRIPLTPGGIA